MPKPVWSPFLDERTIVVPAVPVGLWTRVCDYVAGPLKLKFVAEGDWRYTTKVAGRCTANGDPSSPMSATRCLKTDAPVGALIGKIGGSIAGKADGTVFLVGAFCTLEIDDKVKGALYLTINDEETGFDDNDGALNVSIDQAP